MPQHWSVRWTLQVVWTLTLCCISLSVYEPEQCSRWDSNFCLFPWIHLSLSKWHKMNAVCGKQLNVLIVVCVLDSAVPVCNMAVWNWVQRERLHRCCDSSQPGYPQRVRWDVTGGMIKTLCEHLWVLRPSVVPKKDASIILTFHHYLVTLGKKSTIAKEKCSFFMLIFSWLGIFLYFFDCFSLNTTVNLATKYIILIKKNYSVDLIYYVSLCVSLGQSSLWHTSCRVCLLGWCWEGSWSTIGAEQRKEEFSLWLDSTQVSVCESAFNIWFDGACVLICFPLFSSSVSTFFCFSL